MKKIVVGILVVALVIGTVLYLQKKRATPQVSQIKTYRSSRLGISFSYPPMLTASTTDDSVRLHHDIPYTNTGACDMMGDTTIYDRLTDFDVSIRVLPSDLTTTVKKLSPYIPDDNFVNGELVASPGFIDSYTIGQYSGFAIYEGAEGCGQTTYYFPLADNKTLVVQKASIQALSTAIIQEARNKVLAVPGVITPEQSQVFFQNILTSLIIQ
jgi:hypothetical protein